MNARVLPLDEKVKDSPAASFSSPEAMRSADFRYASAVKSSISLDPIRQAPQMPGFSDLPQLK